MKWFMFMSFMFLVALAKKLWQIDIWIKMPGFVSVIPSFSFGTTDTDYEKFAKVRMCCLTTPKICDNIDYFKARDQQFKNNRIEYERHYNQAKNLNENIGLLNVYMERLWLKTEAIANQITALMTTLFGDFSKKMSVIETTIIARNKSYESFDDVTSEYYSVFDDTISSASHLQGFVSLALLDRIKFYLRKEIAEAARKIILQNRSHFPLSIEVPTISTFSALKTRVLNSKTVKKWTANNQKTVSVFKVAHDKNLEAASSANVILDTLEKGEDCEKSKERSEEAVDELDTAFEILAHHQSEIVELYSNMTKYYKRLTSELRSTSFIAYVQYTKSILQNSSSDYVNMVKDIKKIDDFLEQINSTNNKYVVERITKNLEIAFGHIAYLIACSTSQIELINLAKTRCIEGKSAIKTIVESTLKSQQSLNCSGWITLLDKDKFTALLEKLMNGDGYQKNCLLNNALLKEEICSKQANGDTAEKIADSYKSSVSVGDVTNLLNSCKKISVTNLVSSNICSRKASGTALAEILKSYKHYNESQVNSTYDSCQLTDGQIKDVCNYKSKGYSLVNIQQNFKFYAESSIMSIYNSCALPNLPSYLEGTVCFLLDFMTREEVLSMKIFQAYNNDSVSNAADKC